MDCCVAAVVTDCNPVNNDWGCCTSSNPCGLGEGDCDNDDQCAGDLVCGTDNCAAGAWYMDCCTTTTGTTPTVSLDFLWVGDNSVVDSSNWAQGFPVSGKSQCHSHNSAEVSGQLVDKITK